MAARSAPVRLEAPPDDDRDQRVIMHGLDWWQYETMLAVRGDRSVPRMAYLEGELELMSPSKTHEIIKTTIARLLEAYAGLGVREVWEWRKGRIQVLEGSEYRAVDHSGLLPELDLAALAGFVDFDDQTEAVRAFRRSLRTT